MQCEIALIVRAASRAVLYSKYQHWLDEMPLKVPVFMAPASVSRMHCFFCALELSTQWLRISHLDLVCSQYIVQFSESACQCSGGNGAA